MNAMIGPASTAEIGEELQRLLALAAPRGRDANAMIQAYFSGLKGFPISAIRDAIDGLFSGRFGEKKWLPEAPELAFMVRACLEASGVKAEGRPWAYSKPNSRVRKEGCTKEWAREQVRRGFAPKGSIWTPGPYGENASWGDFWDPDPKWAGPVRIPTKQEVDDARRAEEAAEENMQRRFVSIPH